MRGIRKMWSQLMTFYFLIFYGQTVAKRRVCVIGAGRVGLAAIKIVSELTDQFEPIAFERNSDVGGLWIYTDRTDFDEHGLPIQSSIYKNLRINVPKDIMVYPDYLDFEGKEDTEFVSHATFLEYMRNYTDYFKLRQYIQFNTLVTKVIPVKVGDDWRTTTWRIENLNLNTKEEKVTICDAVMICNGHYSKPKIPKIPGLETFPGQVLHSISYRRPEDFANQTVVLLGAGDSGSDISFDLNYSKVVYLSHRGNYTIGPQKLADNVKEISGVVAANGNKLILQDNTTIVADTFMFCTGYLYDFPFLNESSGIVVDNNGLHPLYEESINAIHPSMAFIGMIYSFDFGFLYYWQAINFLDTLQGKVELPAYTNNIEYVKT